MFTLCALLQSSHTPPNICFSFCFICAVIVEVDVWHLLFLVCFIFSYMSLCLKKLFWAVLQGPILSSYAWLRLCWRNLRGLFSSRICRRIKQVCVCVCEAFDYFSEPSSALFACVIIVYLLHCLCARFRASH